MIVVTGAAGFIGSCIIAGLNQQGESDILAVDRLESDDKYKNLIGLSIDDYVDKDDFIEGIQAGKYDGKIKAIVHMGACSATTEMDATFLMKNNYEYSQILGEFCLRENARYIYASSAATYGDGNKGYSDECDLKSLAPLNPYGFSKSQFDLWAEKRGYLSKMVGLKFFNVYGPNEDHKDDMRSLVNKSFEQINQCGEVKLFKSHRPDYKDGEQLRDFVYVKDAVKVILFFLKHPDKNGVFNVGTGQARSFKDLVTAVFKAMGREPNIQYIDMPLSLQPRYQYYTQATMDKIKQIGYTEPFYSLEEGVTDCVQNHFLKKD